MFGRKTKGIQIGVFGLIADVGWQPEAEHRDRAAPAAHKDANYAKRKRSKAVIILVRE